MFNQARKVLGPLQWGLDQMIEEILRNRSGQPRELTFNGASIR